MPSTHKVLKSVSGNKLSGGRGNDHIEEFERIRSLANMEHARPDHFDRDTFHFTQTKTIVPPDLREIRPFAKSTDGTYEDDSPRVINKNVSFPVRKKFKD